jgi:hypothetical protein
MYFSKNTSLKNKTESESIEIILFAESEPNKKHFSEE